MPPLGYLMCWLIESASMFCIIFYLVPILCLLVGMSWLMIDFVKAITDDLLKMYIRRASQYRWELKVRLCNIIQLHSEVKQLSEIIL